MNYQRQQQLDITPLDFSEAPRLNKSGIPPAMKVVAGICIVVFGIMLLYGSLPEMSPKEIIASDEYVGEQPDRNLLTLENVRSQAPAVSRTAAVSNAPTAVDVAEQQAPTTVSEVVASKEVILTVEPKVAPKPLASKSSVIESVVVQRVPPVKVSVSDTSGFLPVRTVLRDNTMLKAAPEAGSKSVLALGMGVQVTVFETQGSWIYVGTNDGSSITGYVREAELTND